MKNAPDILITPAGYLLASIRRPAIF